MDDSLFAAINGMAGRYPVLDLVMELFGWGGPYALAASLVILWLGPGQRERRDHRQFAVLHATLAAGQPARLNERILPICERPPPFTAHPATRLHPPARDHACPADAA